MLKTIFFDLDDTLLDFTRAEAEAIRRALTEADVPAGAEVLRRYHEINAAQWELLEEGKLTRDQVLVRRFELLFGELGLSRPAGRICLQYEEYLKQGHWFVPGAQALLDLIRRLQSQGTQVFFCGVSSGVRQVMDRSGIARQVGEEAFFWSCLLYTSPSPRDS